MSQSDPKRGVSLPHWGWWLSILPGLVLLGVLALWAPAYAWWAGHVTTFFSPVFLQSLFVAACLIHVMEAGYAYLLCQRAQHDIPQWGWFVQTLFLGFPSLLLLRRKIKELSHE